MKVKRKVLALFLAFAMILSMSATAIAETVPNGFETTSLGEIEKAKSITKLEVVSMPETTECVKDFVSECIDYSGLELRATWSDGTTTDWAYEFDNWQIGDEDIYILQDDVVETGEVKLVCGDASVILTFTIIENPVDHIELVSAPTREYVYGDETYGYYDNDLGGYYFHPDDLTGMVIKVYYTDGTSGLMYPFPKANWNVNEDYTKGFIRFDGCYGNFNDAQPGNFDVTYYYMGKSVSYSVVLKEFETPIDENSAKIVVESKRALCGQDFAVDVTVKNNPGFAYLELTPVYSDELTLVSVTNGELIGDLTKGKQYVWVADEDVLTDGKLMTFNFTTSSDIEPGEYEVGFIVRSCVNGNEKIIDIAVENATIEIVDFTYGDANGDGVINGQDVVRIKKYLANYDYDTETSTTEISAGADANGDGVINGQDVVRLKKYLANYDYETETSTIVLGPQN